MSDIKIVRFTNGEQVVCVVKPQDDGFTLLENAFVVGIDQDSKRLMFNSFAPWSTATGEVICNDASITFITDAHSNIVDQYQDLLDGKLTQRD